MRTVRMLVAACTVATLAPGCFGDPEPDEVFTFGGDETTDDGCFPDEGDAPARPSKIAPPRDVGPEDTEGFCVTLSLDRVAGLVSGGAAALAEAGDLSAEVFAQASCLGVSLPRGLQFILGAGVFASGKDAEDLQALRIPLPSRVGTVSLPRPAVGTTVFVAKVTAFQGERHLRLVTVGRVAETATGGRVVETLDAATAARFGEAMRVDGPGLYGFFVARDPLAFVSGHARADSPDGPGVGGALMTSTGAPFISFADKAGAYTVATLLGQTAVVGYDLATGATGQTALPVEAAGQINPKTGEPVVTPATEAPVDAVDALNLTGVDLVLVEPSAEDPPTPDDPEADLNFDFESGELTPWQPEGDVAVISDDRSTHFPSATGGARAAFVSTGDGAVDGSRSALVRDFHIPRGATRLHVRYALVSQEYPAWLDSPYNDLFVIFRAGSTDFLVRESVQGNRGKWLDYFRPLGNVGASVATVGGVTGRFGGRLAARTATLNLEPCPGGRTVRLVFAVTDIGDHIYDTAVLIDAVWFE
jgi:hypothetical protein